MSLLICQSGKINSCQIFQLYSMRLSVLLIHERGQWELISQLMNTRTMASKRDWFHRLLDKWSRITQATIAAWCLCCQGMKHEKSQTESVQRNRVYELIPYRNIEVRTQLTHRWNKLCSVWAMHWTDVWRDSNQSWINDQLLPKSTTNPNLLGSGWNTRYPHGETC